MTTMSKRAIIFTASWKRTAYPTPGAMTQPDVTMARLGMVQDDMAEDVKELRQEAATSGMLTTVIILQSVTLVVVLVLAAMAYRTLRNEASKMEGLLNFVGNAKDAAKSSLLASLKDSDLAKNLVKIIRQEALAKQS